MTFWHGLTPSFFLVCETLKAGDMCRCMAVLVNTCGQGWPNFILCTPLSHFVTDATWPHLATSGHIWPRLATGLFPNSFDNNGNYWFSVPTQDRHQRGSRIPMEFTWMVQDPETAHPVGPWASDLTWPILPLFDCINDYYIYIYTYMYILYLYYIYIYVLYIYKSLSISNRW